MNKYTNWLFLLLGGLILACGNSKMNKVPTNRDQLNVVDTNTLEHQIFYTLDSMEVYKKDQLDSKKYFYFDPTQKLDTLITEYSYSVSENKLLFHRALLFNAKDREAFFNLPQNEITLKKKTPLFVVFNDSIPNEIRKQSWSIDNNKSKWTLTNNNTKTIYKEQVIKQYYHYSPNEDYQLTDYIYQDTLLRAIITYMVSDIDSSIIRKEKFHYDEGNNLISHSVYGYFKTQKKWYTSSKNVYAYDERGNKINAKYFTYSSESPDSLKLEEESTFKYNSQNLPEYFKSFSKFNNSDFNTTINYDRAGNCILQEINRNDHGYKFGRKEFFYDGIGRLIKAYSLHKNAKNEVFDTLEIQTFGYYNETSFIKKHQSGKSSNNLQTKTEIEFDQYGNIIKAKGEKGKSFTEYKFDYSIPIKAVRTDNKNFYQNMLSPEINEYGLKMNRIKTKVSHAITTRSFKWMRDGKYVTLNESKLYYSKNQDSK